MKSLFIFISLILLVSCGGKKMDDRFESSFYSSYREITLTEEPQEAQEPAPELHPTEPTGEIKSPSWWSN